MLTQADIVPGFVPFHQECEPDVIRRLPANTFVKGIRDNGSDVLVRVLGKRTYWGDPMLEVNGSRYYPMGFYSRLKTIVPLPDADVLAMFPLGTQVSVYSKDPKFGGLDSRQGIVVGHSKRRVRVAMQIGNMPVERTYYPTHLY